MKFDMIGPVISGRFGPKTFRTLGNFRTQAIRTQVDTIQTQEWDD